MKERYFKNAVGKLETNVSTKFAIKNKTIKKYVSLHKDDARGRLIIIKYIICIAPYSQSDLHYF